MRCRLFHEFFEKHQEYVDIGVRGPIALKIRLRSLMSSLSNRRARVSSKIVSVML
jgi:hypothetical protein